MSAAENKQLMQNIFSELSKGNGKPFVESLADDFCSELGLMRAVASDKRAIQARRLRKRLVSINLSLAETARWKRCAPRDFRKK